MLSHACQCKPLLSSHPAHQYLDIIIIEEEIEAAHKLG
jgi:hypothetical protein